MMNNSIVVCLALAICVLVNCVHGQSSQSCPLNSTPNNCLSRCPTTCQNVSNPPAKCLDVCTVGCECNPGFIKVNKSPFSPCVKVYECSLYTGKKTLPYPLIRKKAMEQEKLRKAVATKASTEPTASNSKPVQ